MERGFIFHLRYNIESLCLKKSEDTFLVGQDFCLNLREKTGVALVSIMRESFLLLLLSLLLLHTVINY